MERERGRMDGNRHAAETKESIRAVERDACVRACVSHQWRCSACPGRAGQGRAARGNKYVMPTML